MSASVGGRRTTAFLVLASGLALWSCGAEPNGAGGGGSPDASRPELMVYGVRTGRIDYEISGMQEGRSTAQWADWGRRETERLEARTDQGGLEAEIRQLIVRTPEEFVQIDLATKTATRLPDPIKAIPSRSDGESLGILGEELLAVMGGRRAGTAKVAGKTCDIWIVPRLEGTMCIWKGLMLRQNIDTPDTQFTKVATLVETDVEIPADALRIPAGVRFDEGSTP